MGEQVVADAGGEPLADGEEIAVSLNVTFIHNEPDLRQVVPAIPG